MSQTRKTMIRDFTTGSVPKQLLSFAAPLFFSGLLQTVYNMVDMIVVGNFVGSSGLSAVSIGGEVLILLTFVAMGFSNAGQMIISQLIGAGRRDDVKKMIGTLFTFLLGAALVMMGVCMFMHGTILDWLNTPEESIGQAKDYVFTCICGLVFIYGYNLVSAIMRGMGDSKRPFMFVAVAAVVNLILDLIFVAALGMEAFGAALATVISQSVSFIWALIYLYRRKEQFGFDFKLGSFGIHMDVFRPLVKLGIPMVFQSASITFSKLFITSWVNSYGVIASALTGIGNKLSTVTNVFANAFSTAGGSMIAQNIGAKKYERVPKVILTSFAVDGIVVAIASAVTLIWPRAVFGIFNNEEAVLNMAMIYLPVAIIQYLGCVLRPPMMSLINGSGNSKLNLAIAIFDGIVMRIGFAYFLGVICDLGIQGFWYGNALSGCVPFFIGGIYYLSGKWKKSHVLKEKKI